MVPNARFTELLNDIEPSRTTVEQASDAHRAVRDHLARHDTFRRRWVTSFLAGSYARDTAIRPRSSADGVERPDVDIIVVTSFTIYDAPEKVLNELARALRDGGYDVERINKRSVRVTMSQAEMDIVPVIASGDAFYIPDRDKGYWIVTNPPKHTTWSKTKNDEFSGRFKPLVKLVKWWRRENPTEKRPKGFVLEILVGMHAPKDESHYGEAFAKTLEAIHSAYALDVLLGRKPRIEDPAVPGNDILARVTVAQWKFFIEKVRVHADYARRAQSTEDMEDATRLWRKVFGERFRSTTTAARATSLTSSTAAPLGGYTFPNVPAAPKKPRGFA